MKVNKTKQLKGATSGGFPTMNKHMRDSLDGLTIQEGINNGLITDLGDESGRFIFPHNDYPDRSYAIVNGSTIPISSRLAELEANELVAVLGRLRFVSGISEFEGKGFGKSFFRLGMPADVNLNMEDGYGSVEYQDEKEAVVTK